MLIRLFHEGGEFFMALVLSMWIIVIILTILFIILYRSNKNPQNLKRTNDGILFFGSFAFLIGIYGQMVGFMSALDIIQRTGVSNIDPHNFAGGFKVTFIVTFFGMSLLILSCILWFVFRNLKKYPSKNEFKNQ